MVWWRFILGWDLGSLVIITRFETHLCNYVLKAQCLFVVMNMNRERVFRLRTYAE